MNIVSNSDYCYVCGESTDELYGLCINCYDCFKNDLELLNEIRMEMEDKYNNYDDYPEDDFPMSLEYDDDNYLTYIEPELYE